MPNRIEWSISRLSGAPDCSPGGAGQQLPLLNREGWMRNGNLPPYLGVKKNELFESTTYKYRFKIYFQGQMAMYHSNPDHLVRKIYIHDPKPWQASAEEWEFKHRLKHHHREPSKMNFWWDGFVRTCLFIWLASKVLVVSQCFVILHWPNRLFMCISECLSRRGLLFAS